MKNIKALAVMLGLMSLSLLAACFFLHTAPWHAVSSEISMHASPSPVPSDTLFPGLDEQAVTAVTVSAPDRSFHFLCGGSHVSVNGQQADSEAFLTLLDQISEFPVDAQPAFSPETKHLLLTLTVSSGTQQQVARFYADGHTGEKAHIVVGKGDSPQYRMTGGWRVGALMMTCEGTRILDAHGNETPAKQ